MAGHELTAFAMPRDRINQVIGYSAQLNWLLCQVPKGDHARLESDEQLSKDKDVK